MRRADEALCPPAYALFPQAGPGTIATTEEHPPAQERPPAEEPPSTEERPCTVATDERPASDHALLRAIEASVTLALERPKLTADR